MKVAPWQALAAEVAMDGSSSESHGQRPVDGPDFAGYVHPEPPLVWVVKTVHRARSRCARVHRETTGPCVVSSDSVVTLERSRVGVGRIVRTTLAVDPGASPTVGVPEVRVIGTVVPVPPMAAPRHRHSSRRTRRRCRR